VAQFLLNNDIETQFHLPLSEQAFQEYHDMQQLIQQAHILEEAKDTWTYIYGEIPTMQQPNSIIYHFKISSLQSPLSGSGILDVLIN
jgi:hypothetical protein